MDKHSCVNNSRKGYRSSDKRSWKRKDVNIPAIVKIENKNKNFYCFLVSIADISIGGLKLIVNRSDSELKQQFENGEKFYIVFEDNKKSYVFDAICKPIHVIFDEVMKIGSKFVDVEDDIKSKMYSCFQLEASPA